MSASQAPADRPGRRGRGESPLWSLLELAVLWTFAVAQPLFDLLKDNPEFFAARGSSGLDVISFAVLLVLVPPLLLWGLELLIGLAGTGARRGVHLVFLAALAALIAAQALKKAFDASDLLLILLSVAIGGGLAGLYAGAAPVRSFLRVLSPAPLVFLALFLFTDPISKLAFPEEAQARTIGGVARAPIVMVLLDELPSNTLVDSRGRINAERYPGFAELARTATWFKNAYTVYDSTERAQPAIMDGNLPTEDKQPISGDHPNSIFSLFGKTHRMNVSEEATTVCSRDICGDQREEDGYGGRLSSIGEDLGLVWLHVVTPPDMEADLPSVSENWGNFGGEAGGDTGDDPGERNTRANLNTGREARFEDWIEQIRDGSRPQLSFKHTLLPHVPWQYLPDGRRYRRAANDAIPGLSNHAYRWQSQLDVLLQRHFLQTGFADRELARLWRHLKEQGLYDKSLIVVAADHGVAFPKRRERRRLGRGTAAEIAPVPLLIKAPGQQRGEIDDAWVSTVDILPTIFDVLDLDPKVEIDGKSAFSEEVQTRTDLRMLIRNSFEELRIPAAQFEREREAIINRNLRLFGDPKGSLYGIGPRAELVGTDPAAAGLAKLDVELPLASEYRNVDTASDFVPSHVVGRVRDGGEGGRDIAVAVNGRIVATGETFTLATGREGELVSVMVPPESFEQGSNEVEVFEAG